MYAPSISLHMPARRLTVPLTVYAEKAEAAESKEANKFNCAQRECAALSVLLCLTVDTGAHQNTLEYLPLIITGFVPSVRALKTEAEVSP